MSKKLYLEDEDYLEYCVDFFEKTGIDLLGSGKTRLENQERYEKIKETFSYNAFIYRKSQIDLFEIIAKELKIPEILDWLTLKLSSIKNFFKTK